MRCVAVKLAQGITGTYGACAAAEGCLRVCTAAPLAFPQGPPSLLGTPTDPRSPCRLVAALRVSARASVLGLALQRSGMGCGLLQAVLQAPSIEWS
jgi:hypothetical protein